MEITIKEVEVAKLNLAPGDVLVVTVKSDDIDEIVIGQLGKSFSEAFPNNQVALFGTGADNVMKFSVITALKESGCGTQNYCKDCSCGKKEQAEGK